MRTRELMVWIFATILAASLLAGRAEADTPCPIPDDLVLQDLLLPASKHAITTAHRLVILTLGGSVTAGGAAGDPNATYPARLQAELAAGLPGTQIVVANEASPNVNTTEVPPKIPGLIAKAGANLVIWAPGARDTARRSDPGGFFNAIQDGIDAVRHDGVDLLLIDLQYVPPVEQLSRIEAYRNLLRGAASANDVPLVPRHDLMRAWSEDGTLDFSVTGKAAQTALARRLFSCMAQFVAASILEAVR